MNSRGITIGGINHTWLKGIIYIVDKAEMSKLEAANSVDKFDEVTKADFDKQHADAKKSERITTEHSEQIQAKADRVEAETAVDAEPETAEPTPTTGDDKAYTEKEAYDLNRDEQEVVLRKREVSFKSTDNQDALVKKILDSNPQ